MKCFGRFVFLMLCSSLYVQALTLTTKRNTELDFVKQGPAISLVRDKDNE